MSPRFSALFLIGRVDDVHELLGLQSSTADEAAVDIGLGQQLSSVLGVHAAAVLNGDAAGHAGTVQAPACSAVAVLPVPMAQMGS